ncbi:transcriptional regulator, partial [Lachnospira eligens]
APDLGMIVAGAIISAIGMLVGSLWNKKRHNQKK